MKSAILLLAVLAGSFPQATLAGAAPAEVGFERIWRSVEDNAPALRAARHDTEAAAIAGDRAARHWAPRIFLSGRAFETNDSATNFMFLLNQRQVGAADFAPSLLNHPGSHFFEQGSLGLDFPLFEGGARVAAAAAAKKLAGAKEWEGRSRLLQEYAGAARGYSALLALAEERRQLLALRASVSAVLDRYSIGSKANPVGYSGLLGLKNLRNRVDGLLADSEAKMLAERSGIGALAVDLPAEWQPKPDRARDFLSRAFPVRKSEAAGPAAVRAARLGADAMNEVKAGARAKFLPRVGLFAQGDLYGGSRASATGYSAGAYLQWDLFSAPNIGAVAQAEHEAAAAEARADALARSMESGREASEAGVAAAEKSLALLDESARLLEEQTETARGLFRNGSINALQLVEVLNRRADLLVSRAEAERALGEMKSTLFVSLATEGVPYDPAR